jgi:Rrf2 family transcriptional regulator, iron-sulfur cluster assembly transcription factor
MQVTAKTNYAIKALIDMAGYDASLPKTLHDVARSQNINLAFLSQIFQDLKKNNIVKAIRGSRGGYILAKDPRNLFLAEIFNAVNESANITMCKGGSSCSHQTKCSSHFFLEDLSNHLSEYLRSVSIANLSEKYNNYLDSNKSYDRRN